MGDRAGNGTDDDDSPTALLAMVFSAPRSALAGAQRLLARNPGPYAASMAHQAIGIVQRDFGDLTGALKHLRLARELARQSSSVSREADVCATLGVALVQVGRAGDGINTLDRAIELSRGAGRARVRFRRAGALRILGRYGEAMTELNLALPGLRRAGDVLWTARAVTLRAGLHLRSGAVDRAKADFETAERMFASTEHEHDSAIARQNLACVALAAGELPTALRDFSEADRRFRELGTPMYGLKLDRCEALLTAGLASDALAEAEIAIEGLRRQRGHATRQAELTLLAARAALAAGDWARAVGYARAARKMFDRQQRRWWSLHAQMLEVQAGVHAGEVSPRLARTASKTAHALAALGSGDLAQAHLAAGRCWIALGAATTARPHLVAAAGFRHRGGVQGRISGWLAMALDAESTGDARRLRHACSQGLRLLDEARLLLGAAELRALMTGQGSELARIAQRNCVQAGTARALLTWSEGSRSVTLSTPEARAAIDPELARMLASYRAAAQTNSGPEPSADLRQRQLRLEREIRERVRQRPGFPGTKKRSWTPRLLLDALGNDHLVQIVEVDGRTYQVVCGRGRIRRFESDVRGDVAAEVAYTRSALRRLAFGRPGDMSMLAQTAGNLSSLLIGQAMRHLGDGAVVIVPPARLHGIPWALLPGLSSRVLSIAPSATAWWHTRNSVQPAKAKVALAFGPGLAASDELDHLCALYPHATVLTGSRANVSGVLSAMDGASMAHVAAHGAMRADNPLFSHLDLADGPMTVHDLAGLRRAPHRLVLPSCESAALAPVGADELLGLAAALLPLGTAGIVASADPVNDTATAALMIRLHDALQDRSTLASALLQARLGMPEDPVHQATAASFIAIGAG